MTYSPDAEWRNPAFAIKRLMRRPTVPLNDYAAAQLTPSERDRLRDCAVASRNHSDHGICFVFGVMPRSGTNYLERLLEAHAAVATCPDNLRELPFLAAADRLGEFQDDLSRFYPPNSEVFSRYEWLAYAMAGYVNSLRARADKSKKLTVVKDPHMRNISIFDAIMPSEKAILVVRDGRYVIDSTIRTWPLKPLGRTFEDICLEWQAATAAALDYAATAPQDQVKLVRYEDIVADTAGEMVAIFDWLSLDAEDADQSKLTDAPILGSSTHSREDSGEVGWKPVKNTDGFNPTSRPLEWSAAQRTTFSRICGDTQSRAGYDTTID